jgi:hypothetical protein
VGHGSVVTEALVDDVIDPFGVGSELGELVRVLQESDNGVTD